MLAQFVRADTGVTVHLSVRAAALRTALERATHAVAEVSTPRAGVYRLTAPVDPTMTLAGFQAALRAVQGGDDWGSTAEPGLVTVWTEVGDESP